MHRHVNRGRISTLERPLAFDRTSGSQHTTKAYQVAGLIKVSVVHRYCSCVCGVLVNGREAAIAEICSDPGSGRIASAVSKTWRSVVLRAANSKIGVCRVHGDTHKLRCTKARVVQVSPGDAGRRGLGVIGSPDPAVIARVDHVLV